MYAENMSFHDVTSLHVYVGTLTYEHIYEIISLYLLYDDYIFHCMKL